MSKKNFYDRGLQSEVERGGRMRRVMQSTIQRTTEITLNSNFSFRPFYDSRWWLQRLFYNLRDRRRSLDNKLSVFSLLLLPLWMTLRKSNEGRMLHPHRPAHKGLFINNKARLVASNPSHSSHGPFVFLFLLKVIHWISPRLGSPSVPRISKALLLFLFKRPFYLSLPSRVIRGSKRQFSVVLLLLAFWL